MRLGLGLRLEGCGWAQALDDTFGLGLGLRLGMRLALRPGIMLVMRPGLWVGRRCLWIEGLAEA